jgi:hypothetical protein
LLSSRCLQTNERAAIASYPVELFQGRIAFARSSAFRRNWPRIPPKGITGDGHFFGT